MKYVVANWKSHKREKEVLGWVEEFSRVYKPIKGVEVIIAPPFPYLLDLRREVEKHKLEVRLAAQDISPFPFGAYTGAVAAEMVKGMVEYAVVGHSERRKYFHETHMEIANKIAELHEVGIKPILCVDDEYVREQVNALGKEDKKKVIVAYEPLEAIGTDQPQEPKEAIEVAEKIKKVIEVPIIYGGSVTEENVGDYILEPLVGVLVGGASLEAERFARIVEGVAG